VPGPKSYGARRKESQMRMSEVTRGSVRGVRSVLPSVALIALACAHGPQRVVAIPEPPLMPVTVEAHMESCPAVVRIWVDVEVEGYFERLRGMRDRP